MTFSKIRTNVFFRNSLRLNRFIGIKIIGLKLNLSEYPCMQCRIRLNYQTGVTLQFQVCQYCPRHHNHRHLRLLLHRRRDHRSRCAATTCPMLAPNFRSHLCQRILYTILISDMRKSSAMSRTHSELPVCPHCCRVTTSLELVSEVWGVDSALCRAPRQTCDPSQAAHEC